MAMGRPTKYRGEETIAAVHAYIATGWIDQGDAFPQLAGLSVNLGVSRDTIWQWSRDADKPDFSDALGSLLARQERELINQGIKGEFNAVITKLALMRHGYSDRASVEHTGAAGGPIEMITSEMDPKRASQLYEEMLKQ